ncbi:hypothetical protein [Halospeciosus flavus]|uniref:hypothetical protein n=1 Tax=Halospeciosus flavus TaxID=3032283 RepID=UPI00361110EF
MRELVGEFCRGPWVIDEVCEELLAVWRAGEELSEFVFGHSYRYTLTLQIMVSELMSG